MFTGIHTVNWTRFLSLVISTQKNTKKIQNRNHLNASFPLNKYYKRNIRCWSTPAAAAPTFSKYFNISGGISKIFVPLKGGCLRLWSLLESFIVWQQLRHFAAQCQRDEETDLRRSRKTPVTVWGWGGGERHRHKHQRRSMLTVRTCLTRWILLLKIKQMSQDELNVVPQ